MIRHYTAHNNGGCVGAAIEIPIAGLHSPFCARKNAYKKGKGIFVAKDNTVNSPLTENKLNRSLKLIYVYAIATGAIFTFIGYWDSIFYEY